MFEKQFLETARKIKKTQKYTKHIKQCFWKQHKTLRKIIKLEQNLKNVFGNSMKSQEKTKILNKS